VICVFAQLVVRTALLSTPPSKKSHLNDSADGDNIYYQLRGSMKLITLLAVLFFPAFVYGQLLEVPQAGGAPTKTFLYEVSKPKAVVLLFIGGDGMLDLKTDGSTGKQNPLIRSAELWQSYEINSVLVDSPYDLGDARRGNVRGKSEHLARVESVVKYYKNKFNVPIWIFGHSMGTVTVIQYVNQGEKLEAVSGAIIAGTHIGETLSNNFSKPVMAIHHQKEACAATPIRASESIIKARSKETKSELVMIDGGEDVGLPCMGLAYHGFNKVEDKMVNAAAKFILAN
jgi:dienelactone hydrolase